MSEGEWIWGTLELEAMKCRGLEKAPHPPVLNPQRPLQTISHFPKLSSRKSHFHHIMSKVITIILLFMIAYIDFDHLAKVLFVRFLHCKITALFPYCTLWKEVTICNLHLRSKCYVSFLRMMYLQKLLCEGFMSYLSFIKLFNHLFIPVWSPGYLFHSLGNNSKQLPLFILLKLL